MGRCAGGRRGRESLGRLLRGNHADHGVVVHELEYGDEFFLVHMELLHELVRCLAALYPVVELDRGITELPAEQRLVLENLQ